MIDSFICRYGNQDIERVRNMPHFERAMFFNALLKHLETEFSDKPPPDPPPTESV